MWWPIFDTMVSGNRPDWVYANLTYLGSAKCLHLECGSLLCGNRGRAAANRPLIAGIEGRNRTYRTSILAHQKC